MNNEIQKIVKMITWLGQVLWKLANHN